MNYYITIFITIIIQKLLLLFSTKKNDYHNEAVNVFKEVAAIHRGECIFVTILKTTDSAMRYFYLESGIINICFILQIYIYMFYIINIYVYVL